MKEDWTLIEYNGGKRYERVFHDVDFCITELNKYAFELSYGVVVINYSYQDFESAEKEAIKIATEHSKFEEDMKKFQEEAKLDVLKFNFDYPRKSNTDWASEWYKDEA